LLRHKIATLPELKDALGTTGNLTAFRKLKRLDYLSRNTRSNRKEGALFGFFIGELAALHALSLVELSMF
jgi:hypothetical protein